MSYKPLPQEELRRAQMLPTMIEIHQAEEARKLAAFDELVAAAEDLLKTIESTEVAMKLDSKVLPFWIKAKLRVVIAKAKGEK